jgi:hypothetical protein
MRMKQFQLLMMVCCTSALYAADVEQQYLTVTTPFDSCRWQVPYDPSMTIYAIKQHIKNQDGIELDRQILWKSNGSVLSDKIHTPLENDKTCEHYNVRPDSTIWFLMSRKIEDANL